LVSSKAETDGGPGNALPESMAGSGGVSPGKALLLGARFVAMPSADGEGGGTGTDVLPEALPPAAGAIIAGVGMMTGFVM
jgi:hypothetical protein